MQKLLLLRKSMVGKLLLLFALFGTTNYAMAQKETTEIFLDTQYSIPMFGSGYYHFVAPKTGTLSLECTYSDYPRLYKDNTFTEALIEGTKYDNPRWEYDVTEGTTYYLGIEFTMGDITFELKMSDENTGPQTFTSIGDYFPSAGSILSGSTEFGINFGGEVTIGSATLTSGSNTVTLTPQIQEGFYYSIILPIGLTVYNWLKDGLVQPGDDVTLVVTDIKQGKKIFAPDGNINVTYKVPRLLTLDAVKYPKELKCWAADDASGEGIVEYTFNEAPSSAYPIKAVVQNQYNPNNGGDQVAQTIDFTDKMTIDGNKITVDLRGFKFSDYTELDDYFTVELNNIHAQDGSYYYDPEAGSASQGSISKLFHFNRGEDVDVTPPTLTFNPDEGSDIKDVDAIQIYADFVTAAFVYTGAKFDYTISGVPQSVTVAKDKFEVVNGGTDLTMTIPVPKEELQKADEGSNVLFTLMNGDKEIQNMSYTWGTVGDVDPNDPSAINNATVDNAVNGAMFNLAGQKVGEGYNGVVIKNGKKTLKR